MSVSEEQLRKIYKLKAKKPELVDYDDDGNLIEKSKTGEILRTVPLPQYRPATFEELEEIEKKRISEIAESEKAYENAREELRRANDIPNTPISEILRINRKVAELDANLQNIRFPLRYVEKLESLEVRDIIFTDIHEKRKLPYDIGFLKSFPFELHDFYVRIGEPIKRPIKTLTELKEKYSGPSIVIVSDDNDDYKSLALRWAVEIEFNATRYNSAFQAIMAELAKSFNDQNNLQRIMLADDPYQIEYSYKDISGDPDANEAKWNNKMKELLMNVNYEKFRQFPELANKLLETKNAPLAYYEPDDNLLGIGVSPDDENSKNPANWSGQNILGKILETIRTKINEDRMTTAQIQQQQVMMTQPAEVQQKRLRKRTVAIEK